MNSNNSKIKKFSQVIQESQSDPPIDRNYDPIDKRRNGLYFARPFGSKGNKPTQYMKLLMAIDKLLLNSEDGVSRRDLSETSGIDASLTKNIYFVALQEAGLLAKTGAGNKTKYIKGKYYNEYMKWANAQRHRKLTQTSTTNALPTMPPVVTKINKTLVTTIPASKIPDLESAVKDIKDL